MPKNRKMIVKIVLFTKKVSNPVMNNLYQLSENGILF